MGDIDNMSVDTEPKVGKLLDSDGPLAENITGFQVRPQQQAMVEAVEFAIKNYSKVVIEAGTGVGKTFAYLVPALASGGRTIISTGSKTLQDQLFQKDIPLVKKALKTSTKVALLKGRANYLCIHRLNLALADGKFSDRRTVSHLHRINDWAGMTDKGDVAEITTVPHDSEAWPRVTSTADNCLGVDCDFYEECYVVNARRDAQAADIVVVNHHLFFADLALKDEGFGELLPSANAIILDEAHQLPEIASTFFSEIISSRQLQEWVRDTLAESLIDAKDMPAVRDELRAMDKAILDLRLAMDKPGQRAPWYKIKSKPPVKLAMQTLMDIIAELLVSLEELASRGKGLKACYERLQEQSVRLKRLQSTRDNTVQWFETFTRSFTLITTPLDIAEPFSRQMDSFPCAWVFTSATLAVGQSFEHYIKRIGVTEAKEELLDSPFDYWHNALLYAPEGMPEPQQVDFVPSVVSAAVPVIKACGGRTFMLFTSYRALNEAAELLEGQLDYPMLVQGESPQRDMIERFRELGNAVLLGTSSFWEGVDVRGEALSCVIIDKFPFASPNDPVLEARIQAIRENQGNPFGEYQLPQAVIAMKQGVGRLIRDATDKGVLMICDPRLISRQYGKTFLDSMPRMPRTRKLDVVQRFFSIHNKEATEES